MAIARSHAAPRSSGALFVAVFGSGPLAGTLAIACRSVGFTGKLFAEAMEEASPGPLEAAGAPAISRLLLGYWPQVKLAFWPVALFRWDINIRESADRQAVQVAQSRPLMRIPVILNGQTVRS